MSVERSELDSLEELVDIAAEEISQAVMNRENLKPGSKFMGVFGDRPRSKKSYNDDVVNKDRHVCKNPNYLQS
ncbi:hypothetical protein NSQ96_17035 [Caldifermentibacillus hisashii]|uniref:Uncharacterized protein n=1 Tax=Caldifermentibacillus hisashii TaxID=996558 RepID=A0ABU9K1F8_9BACI